MSFKLENTKKYLKEYTKSLLEDAVVEIQRTDRTRNYSSRSITTNITASGSLEESLSIVEKNSDSILKLDIEGNAYAEKIDQGTKSTSVSKDKLIQWINNKKGFKDLNGNLINLNDTAKIASIASIISRSLKLKGIHPTGFLTDLIKQKLIELKNIHEPVVLDMELDIDNVLLKLGYKKKGNETYTIETKTIQ
tara:strand:- start:3 stop:581 length:579 start_codon:yes stop_codon:yes gene_type:complete